jgi:hypothetical protein
MLKHQTMKPHRKQRAKLVQIFSTKPGHRNHLKVAAVVPIDDVLLCEVVEGRNDRKLITNGDHL